MPEGTHFYQVDGDWGNPFEWGGEWIERKDPCPVCGECKPTGGYMKMFGNDAGGPGGRSYIKYKHVSKSENITRRDGWRTEEWCNKWIRDNDIDCKVVTQ